MSVSHCVSLCINASVYLYFNFYSPTQSRYNYEKLYIKIIFSDFHVLRVQEMVVDAETRRGKSETSSDQRQTWMWATGSLLKISKCRGIKMDSPCFFTPLYHHIPEESYSRYRSQTAQITDKIATSLLVSQ